ncbi:MULTISPECIES: FGGY-family carbohydrate kinase [unclassified Chelatococcus]|uniref:xylulokinase n=1 Tax=unclassified Chelatococcus TaxID=2638111 RepID=UPI001BCC8DFD|nr:MULTISPECIES: FGGY-family carbohydrate kinase [unclassified Chelatococcus]CAH1648351.1 Xylulokinase [Hyphomicrobiales bacterium]MBS7741977.1 FGGY-family carbohydrate kinase [Chelatococcus sp. HY11]MBX3541225.1 FGGY-family carbohydrate kinase [Chelatococcus sp.]MCO5074882.1 FGGY-family carbohydrate kinase [Chelatococcus sp.]CAH1690839.1 Xylulokinase [Hyphomicrobiales bacterium]
MSVVLAFDLGGTSFRAALIDAKGTTHAECAIFGPTIIDRLGWSEVDANDWWRTLIEACHRLADEEPGLFASIAGIAICGVTRTQVFLGRDGRQLRQAMTWKDTRADATAKRLQGSLPGLHPETARINAFHPLARLAWLREQEEATFRSLARVLEPKDYLNFRLTGVEAGDPVSMARLMASAETIGGADLLSAVGASTTLLPRAIEPCDEVGRVLDGLPSPLDQLAGVPVFCCSSDTWAAAAGLGALRVGYAYNISGTTEVLGLISETPAEAEGLLTVDWRGLHQLGGPSQNGADTVAWLLSLLGRIDGDYSGVGKAMDALLAGRRHPQPLVFLPYLQGERVPYWDPTLRGALVGLNRQHGATDVAWAVLEGIAFLNRIVLERAEQAAGLKVTEIRFGGGAAANPAWRQVKADVCGRPVVVGASKEPGLLGAAIVAWTGIGQFTSLAEAQDALVSVASRHEPDPARAAVYGRLFALFRQSEQALAPISRELAALSRQSETLPGVHASPLTDTKDPSP